MFLVSQIQIAFLIASVRRETTCWDQAGGTNSRLRISSNVEHFGWIICYEADHSNHSRGIALVVTYQYAGIDLLAPLTGTLVLEENCLKIKTTVPPDRDLIAVLPRGSRVSASGVQFPVQNGGRFIAFSQTFSAQGGFETLDANAHHIENRTKCNGSAFVVSRIIDDEKTGIS
jgi:hypothetical protein